MNEKQLIFSANRVAFARNLVRKRFLSIMAFMLMLNVGLAYANDFANAEQATGAAVVTAGIMTVVGNITEVDNQDKSGKQVNGQLWILEYSQYDNESGFPSRAGISVGTIPLKSGELWHYIDTVEDSPEPKSKGEKGDVATTIMNTIPFIVGGMSDNTIQLLENGVGKKFYVVWTKCGDNPQKWLGGDGCKPMVLKSFEGGAGKDYTGYEITFENESNKMFSKYSGTLVYAQPSVVAADATEIAYSTAAQQYQLTDGSAAVVDVLDITGITDSDNGKVIEILGSGGTYPPTISTGGNFIVASGAQWSGTAGSRISFRVMKTGAAAYSFIEVNRVQIA